MKYESLQKMTVITGLLVFSLGICSYADSVTLKWEMNRSVYFILMEFLT